MGGDAPERHQPPRAGEVIAGKYVVEEVLGGGGMGVVIAARHQQLDKRVAIKLLPAKSAANPDAVTRFLREARASVSLQSEHVARVTDVGTLDSGVPYIIMDLLEGVDLETLLEEHEQLPVDTAVDYLLQACEAIAEAHALGIVHRDLKPGNLFLTQRVDGAPLVKVLDFGIAKAFDAEGRPTSNLTTTGMALGTPSYMAPEQVRDAKLVDRRTDIWGLGSVLFQLLTGRPPFEADNVPALCAKIVADPAPTLVSLRPEVPARLSEIVGRCLEKDMQRRHQSVAALAQALAEVAPETSQERIARILRVAALRNSLSPSQSGDWSLRDSLTDTVVSSSGASAAGEVTITGSVAATAKPSSARDGSVNDTGGAWQTDPRPPHRRTALALATAVVIGGGLLWWAAPWSGDPDAPVVAPPEPAAAREPPADRREQAARETEAAPPPASASADASPVRPPRAAAPVGQVKPPTTTPPEPPPAASASASLEPRKDPLLDDRK